MVKICIFYSLTHNKVIVKYSTGVNQLEVGSINQYNQLLLQVINIVDLQHVSSLKRIKSKLKYVKKINSIYREQIKTLDRERRTKLDVIKITSSRRSCSRHN